MAQISVLYKVERKMKGVWNMKVLMMIGVLTFSLGTYAREAKLQKAVAVQKTEVVKKLIKFNADGVPNNPQEANACLGCAPNCTSNCSNGVITPVPAGALF
jgi:hypothetical protein